MESWAKCLLYASCVMVTLGDLSVECDGAGSGQHRSKCSYLASGRR